MKVAPFGCPEKTPDNGRYILGRPAADFRMLRHRDAFDQIRLSPVSDMKLGEQGVLREERSATSPRAELRPPGRCARQREAGRATAALRRRKRRHR
jgi:hypothetical protein